MLNFNYTHKMGEYRREKLKSTFINVIHGKSCDCIMVIF